MPSLEHTVTLGYLDRDAGDWDEAFPETDEELTFERVPFDHPLWVLYSSGTTGLPKAIVHSQGGILLEHLKKHHLHVDAQDGDRIFWFTTTGWMMWNFLVSVLLTDASIVLYDGNPGSPDMGVLWDLAEQTGMTCFGTSAAYIAACMKAEIEPADGRDLSRAAQRRLDRLAARARGLRVDLRARRARHVAVLHQRRHRPLHGVRRRRPRPAGLPRRAAGPLARRARRGVGRGRQRGGRRGRRARDHRADALDAHLLLGRPGRRAAARVLLRDVPGDLAPRRLDPHHRARHRASSPGARTRRSTAAASAWARRRSTAPCSRSTRSPTRSWSTSPGRRRLDAAVRRAARGRRARRGAREGDRRAHPRGLLSAPRSERGLRGRQRSRGRCRARCSRCRSRRSSPAPPRTRRRAATRSPTRRRSTGSSSSPSSAPTEHQNSGASSWNARFLGNPNAAEGSFTGLCDARLRSRFRRDR